MTDPLEGKTGTDKKTGRAVVRRGGQWIYSDAKLTEDQGKAQTYGRLMATAEGQYQGAVRNGYNPGSLRNAAADVASSLHIPGFGEPLAGLAPVIRDDVSDQGAAAEQLWRDAQLKALSGAASPEAEVSRNRQTYFPHFGDKAAGEQMSEARRAAYEAARVRAGPAAKGLPAYPGAPGGGGSDPLGIRGRR